MAKRKKRNAITIVSLLLALAALIGVYVWFGNYKTASDNAEVTDSTIDLVAVDTTQISSLHYVKDDADLTLVRKEGAWISEEDPERPMNQDYVQKMEDAIADIKAERIIMEKPDNLADYGLKEPTAYLQATMADGTAVTVQIGAVAGDNDGYYGLVNDDGIVYLLPSDTGVALKYNDTQMTAVAKDPSITAANINHISIENRDGEDYELKNTDDNKLDNSGSNLYSWEILKPYGEGYTADSTKITDVQSNYTSFSYQSCVDYKGEELSKYGLEDPVAIIALKYTVERTEKLEKAETDPDTGEEITEKTYQDPYEYKVYVGNLDEEGNYYVRVDGSNSVYTIAADTIDKMIKIDVFSLMNPYVLIPAIDNVDQIVMKCGETTDTMDIKYTTSTNDNGEDESVATYYYNDKKVDETAFKSLYQSMVSITYDNEITQDVKEESVTPYMTISYHIVGDNEQTVTASFLPYNDSFYIIKKADGAHFFADKRAVDSMVTEVSSFTGAMKE